MTGSPPSSQRESEARRVFSAGKFQMPTAGGAVFLTGAGAATTGLPGSRLRAPQALVALGVPSPGSLSLDPWALPFGPITCPGDGLSDERQPSGEQMGADTVTQDTPRRTQAVGFCLCGANCSHVSLHVAT